MTKQFLDEQGLTLLTRKLLERISKLRGRVVALEGSKLYLTTAEWSTLTNNDTDYSQLSEGIDYFICETIATITTDTTEWTFGSTFPIEFQSDAWHFGDKFPIEFQSDTWKFGDVFPIKFNK